MDGSPAFAASTSAMPRSAEPRGGALRRLLVRAAILAGICGLLVLALSQLPYQWRWRSVWRYRAVLGQGLLVTLELSLAAMVVGLACGVAGCLLRLARLDALRFLGTCYVEIIRNTPLLVQLYIAYFCIFPALGYQDPPVIGAVALGVFAGAYITEILRAGVLAVDPGQTEAALSLGLSPRQALRFVVAPQAFRQVIPPLAGQLVSLVKDSSLLSTIAIAELTLVAQASSQRNYRFFEFYLAIAALYLAITFPLSRVAVWLERRLQREGRA